MIATTVGLPHAATGYVGHPDVVVLGTLPDEGPLVANARVLAGRIDTRALVEDARRLADPSGGMTFVFRYGAVVSIAAADAAAPAIDAALKRYLRDPADAIEAETAEITLTRQRADRIGEDGQILLAEADEARLTLVAIVLARSAVLSRDEILVSHAFDRIAPLVSDLRETGRTRFPVRHAMRLVGEVLAARHRVMATVQADERPDVLWDNPELDRLYARLEAEHELDDRAEVLERKFVALGDFAEVLLNIIQDKRAFRLELAVIALIAFEILLALVDMHWR